MEDLRQIIGDTKIIMAVKKNPSIGNTVVMNKFLSSDEQILDNQKCGATNCMQCPLVNTNTAINVNGLRVKAAKTLNCKSRNVIYLWQCQICENENSYFGRTIQIHIGAAFQKKNGKILPYLCIPVPVTRISLTCRTSKSLWSKSVPLRESVGKNPSTLISLRPGEYQQI